jgi:Tfp pilus assembly protein PilN
MFGGVRRKVLGRLFWMVLGVGVVLELVALFILVRNAFTVPA